MMGESLMFWEYFALKNPLFTVFLALHYSFGTYALLCPFKPIGHCNFGSNVHFLDFIPCSSQPSIKVHLWSIGWFLVLAVYGDFRLNRPYIYVIEREVVHIEKANLNEEGKKKIANRWFDFMS
uniref:Uncharacterized protein n=1 Tax=Kalanchoe fedtschenkoi TaxID=63787 RepID=A0A7N0UAN1_KALFE